MSGSDPHNPAIDWSRATYEGSAREAMRRWAELPLERILAAQEEMAELAEALGHDLQPFTTPHKVDKPGTDYGDSNRSIE